MNHRFEHWTNFSGFRNSKLGFLRRQQNYFLLDGLIHLTNTIIHSRQSVGTLVYCFWIYAFAVHIYYYYCLTMNPPPRRQADGEKGDDNSEKIPRIFHWSCVEYQANRFSIFESGREIFETTTDVFLHTAGFLLAFRQIQSIWYRLFSIALMFVLFYRRMLTLKYFLTDPKMMPPQLQRFFGHYSTTPMSQ